MSFFTIYDLEWTTWEGAVQRQWTGENEYKEIIQIGAVKVKADDLSVVEQMNILVKPKHNPILSDYCSKLTGITQESLDQEGVPFEKAFHQFMDFVTGGVAYAYGNDAMIFAENTLIHRINPKRLYGYDREALFIDIGYAINRFAVETRHINSGRLWQILDQPRPEGVHEHDALFDCHSILAAIRVLRPRGLILPGQE